MTWEERIDYRFNCLCAQLLGELTPHVRTYAVRNILRRIIFYAVGTRFKSEIKTLIREILSRQLRDD